jgi:CheY-like chemotaxis protein
MTNYPPHDDTPPSPPEDFTDHVRQALETLYDLPALNRHPLAASAPQGSTSEPQGQRLRRELINTIEALNPGKDLAQRPTASRTYNLLHMHYVGGMTLQEAAHQLGISLRQAYRDLKTGCDGVAELMWFNRQSTPQQQPPAAGISSLADELARLEGQQAPTDLLALCQSALKAVQRLTEQYHVSLSPALPAHPVVVSVNSAAAQQVMISLLSSAVQAAQPHTTLHIALSQAAQSCMFSLTLTPRSDDSLALAGPIQQMITRLRFQFNQVRVQGGQLHLQLGIPAYGTRILAIDDNHGLLDLLQRLLPEPRYKVTAAATSADGLSYAAQFQPDAILLDLMMPDLNGWDVLQTLRADERTRAIPVIICSVVSDPELAYSLGANAVIAKPIQRAGLLQALEALGL